MEIEDLKKFQSELTEQVREVENTIHSELRSAEDVARSAVAEVTGAPRVESLEGKGASVAGEAEKLPDSTTQKDDSKTT
jgi:hypothetical protein